MKFVINGKYLINSIITSDLVASLMILIYVALKPMENINSEIVTSIEVILTFLYLVDLVIRRMAQKNKFMQSLWNIFDIIFFILILILTFIFNIFELHKNVSKNFVQDQDMLGFLILSLRYLFQIIRVIFIFYRSKNIYNIHKYSQALNIDINCTYNSYKDSFVMDPFKTNLFNEINNQSFKSQQQQQQYNNNASVNEHSKLINNQQLTNLTYYQ